MSSMIRTIRRRMIRQAARRGIEGQRNKRARFAAAWAVYQGKSRGKSPAGITAAVTAAMRRLGLMLKGGRAVEE